CKDENGAKKLQYKPDNQRSFAIRVEVVSTATASAQQGGYYIIPYAFHYFLLSRSLKFVKIVLRVVQMSY
ncbi:MAG: hypothetical protein ABFC56_12380, partial [Clostridiaceae bacterium]